VHPKVPGDDEYKHEALHPVVPLNSYSYSYSKSPHPLFVASCLRVSETSPILSPPDTTDRFLFTTEDTEDTEV